MRQAYTREKHTPRRDTCRHTWQRLVVRTQKGRKTTTKTTQQRLQQQVMQREAEEEQGTTEASVEEWAKLQHSLLRWA